MKQCLVIIIITFAGANSPLQAQQLASEKPVESFYSVPAILKLRQAHNDRQPAAREARLLPSQKAVQQASVPKQIKPGNKQVKRRPGSKKPASERPVDMEKINRRRSRASQASQ
jgi:hypothetical protein